MIKPRIKPVTLGRRVAKYVVQARYGSRPTKPALKWRALGNYGRYLRSGRPPLRFCDLAVTYDCNMVCAHCSAARLGDPSREPMTVADYARLGGELRRAGVLSVQITGGEPLLRDDLEEIIAALNVSVVTNSSLATRERLRSLKGAGLDNLCVSIDSWDEAEHDAARGSRGNRALALTTLEAGLAEGLTGMVFHVVTHQGLQGTPSLMRLVDYTTRKGVLLVLGWAVPAGNWNANRDVLLDDDDLLHLESIHERYPHVRTDFETNYFHWGCGAVKEKLYITPYGDVLPCAFVHVSLGNVFETPIETIRQSAMAIDWFREHNGRCLAATDREFIDEHMARIFESPHEPVSLEEAGLLPSRDKR